MEFSNFLKILLKHKLTIIIVPIITVIIAYFLVRNQPDVYSSQAKIATGIVDQTQKVLIDFNDSQESKTNQEFNNLIELLRSKKMIEQLSYTLMIHDLTSNEPYRKPSKLLNQLNASARQHAIAVFTGLLKNRGSLSLYNADQAGLNRVLVSMRYDYQSILNTLTVYRSQGSDYIIVQFESENAALCAVVVNNLSNEFITYYGGILKDSKKKTVTYLANLLSSKQDTLNKRLADLRTYKIKNHILNLDEKAKSLYGQLSDFETRKEEVEKNVVSTQAAINDINNQFDPKGREYAESGKVAVSQQILATQAQLKVLNDEYVQSNFNPTYKKKIDSLTSLNSSQINQLSDKYVLNPLAAKQTLVEQKLALQMQNNLAKNSYKSVDKELGRLYQVFNGLVPHEGTVQALESDVSIASQEYLQVLAKFNQSSLASDLPIQLRLVEAAEPGTLQPSKKMLLVFISGIVSFIFCFAVLFLLFFFDNTIKNARELANRTGIPVLGYLNILHTKAIDLGQIWHQTSATAETRQFRNLMQSLRFEVDDLLAGDKLVLINSIEKAAGKTFVAINLAYAYALIKKRVLLIDANFGNPGITASTQTKFYLEDFLNGDLDNTFLSASTKTTVLGNKGGDVSLLEISDAHNITEKFARLKDAFDIVIIEASALDTLNKSKELVPFAGKILTVFEAGKSITEKDKQAIEYLKTRNGKFIGWVLNLVTDEQLVNEKDEN
ncbi:MAG: GumC family protein [Mucilaginibacter sp.]